MATVRNAIAGAALAWALIAAPAAAQTVDPAAETSGASQEQGDENAGQAPAAEDIIVTGSRIPRSATDTIAPVRILSSRDLDRRAFSTLGDALNEQPQFGVPGSSPVGGGQSDLGPGQSFVNFLGLGSQRTLVLVNGRRFVSSNTSSIFGPTGSGGTQVDLNVIPTKLIDRVETVAAIGAPIYGSDAIAGTINVRLKRNFEGNLLDGTAGISEEGDAGNYRVRALTGVNFLDDRANLTVAGEYNVSNGLVAQQRAEVRLDDRFGAPRTRGSFLRVPVGDFRVPSIAITGIPLVGDFFSTSPQQSTAFFGARTSISA